MAPRAVLVGMPGSGKSTIGRRLAKALDVPLLDTDAKIVETTGRTIADIFVDGEPAFRRIEADVVRAALAEHAAWSSLGGGADHHARRARGAGRPHRGVPGDQCGRRRSTHRRAAPRARCSPAATRREVPRADGAARAAVPRGRHDAGQHQPPQPGRRGAPHRAQLECADSDRQRSRSAAGRRGGDCPPS